MNKLTPEKDRITVPEPVENDPLQAFDDIGVQPRDTLFDRWPDEPADSLLNLVEFRAKREPDGACKIDVVYHSMTKELTIERSQEVLHFSDRFGWGVRGADAIQTAIAILLEATNSEDFAWRLHEEFERQIIGTFPHEGWTMLRESIYLWIDINDSALLPPRHRSPESQNDKS
jgi:hypothetical protein